MSMSVDSGDLFNSSSTFNKRPRPQLKLKLNNNTKGLEENQVMISQNSTSSYLIENYPLRTDLTQTMSSSNYICKKIFFGEKHQTKVYEDFSFLANNYYVTQRANGKEQQDRYKIKTSAKVPGLSFFAVYDGHSTDIIAELLADKLDEYIVDSYESTYDIDSAIREAFQRAENEVIQRLQGTKPRGGSTALCGIFYHDALYVANLGDARAVMFQNNELVTLSSLHDFTNSKEIEFVENNGGVVLNKRLEGELAVSRSIGDLKYKAYMNKEPEIMVHKIQHDDEYFFLATDGFWNGLNPTDALEKIQSFKQESRQNLDMKILGDSLLEEACRNVKTKKDNMTLIIVDIKELMNN